MPERIDWSIFPIHAKDTVSDLDMTNFQPGMSQLVFIVVVLVLALDRNKGVTRKADDVGRRGWGRGFLGLRLESPLQFEFLAVGQVLDSTWHLAGGDTIAHEDAIALASKQIGTNGSTRCVIVTRRIQAHFRAASLVISQLRQIMLDSAGIKALESETSSD